MADNPKDPRIPVIYTTDKGEQYRLTVAKSISDAVSAAKAPTTMPLLPSNVVPRKVMLQLDAVANKGQTSAPIKIVVPHPAMPVFAKGAVAIPIVKYQQGNLYIPVKRECEKIKNLDLFKK